MAISILYARRNDSYPHVHFVQLGAGRDDLLDPELTQLGLQLAELLQQLILVLGPQLAGLDSARGL